MRRRYGYARFDWDFCDDLTQSDRTSHLIEAVSAGILRLEMMLLIFMAGPVREFRFGFDRHKYATSFARWPMIESNGGVHPAPVGGESPASSPC
jgi:hypothetical protein